MEGIKKWLECTITSPIRLPLRDLQNAKKKKNQTKQAAEETNSNRIQQGHNVLHLIFDIMSVALAHTYTLQWWHKVWTLFIKKEIGNPDTNKL